MSNTKIKAGQFSGIVGNGTDGYFLMTNGDGTMAWQPAATPSPTLTSVTYPGDDTAADPAGGQSVTLTGTNFLTGATVTIGGTTAPTVSFVSATELTITTPAKTAGDYDIVVTNTDGKTATFVDGISYNGIPSWATASGSLGTFASDTTISTITLQASEPDAGSITFNITSGALPTGLSLTGADIDGTTSKETADTLYNFTVTAIDDENQSTPRAFSITVEKYIIPAPENFEIVTYTGNGGTQAITSKIGKAASFNGSSSYIDTGIKNTVGTRSISLWFYYTSAPASIEVLIGAVSTGLAGYTIRLETSVLKFQHQGESTASTALSNLNVGWNHVVGVIDGSTSTLYLNGSSVGTGGVADAGSHNLYIGAENGVGSAGSYFDGKIDQVRIFNRALDETTDGEVTTLYNETYASSTKSTTDIFGDGSGIALYELDEDANDSSGTILVPTHYFFVTDAGNQNSSVRVNSIDSEFTYTRPSGYDEWGGTFDPNNYYGGSFTLSESNKKWDKVGTFYNAIWSTNGYNSGKYYFELEFLGNELIFGISKLTVAEPPSNDSFKNNSINYSSWSTLSYKYSLTNTNSSVILSINDVIGFAVDFDNGELKYYRNNTLIDTVTMPSSNYNGTPTNVNFLGMAFQPDLVWMKGRTYAGANHFSYDSVRGATQTLYPNLTNAEGPDTNALTSFDSNGFTIGSYIGVNTNNEDYVAWCWKAGGSVTPNNNTNGTITSTVSANQDAGFSIVKYSGNTGANQTVGHGLSSTPEMVIVKRLTDSGNSWCVQHTGLTSMGYNIYLDLDSTELLRNRITAWNPTTFTVEQVHETNNTGKDYIAYCFHSVDGYQKVGSYIGSGVAGKIVYTDSNGDGTGTGAFKPRFLLVKASSVGGNWNIHDSIRDTGDDNIDKFLIANSDNAEIDTSAARFIFNDNGFEVGTSDVSRNALDETYIYLAIA